MLQRKHEVDATVPHSQDQKEAQRILATGLMAVGLGREEMAVVKKGDVRKAVIARVIRDRTAVPSAWIAAALPLGHVSRVHHCHRLACEHPEFLRRVVNALENGCDSKTDPFCPARYFRTASIYDCNHIP